MTRPLETISKIVVVKIGGSTLGEGDSSIPDIVALQDRGYRPIVVHGGGKVISDWVSRQGIMPEFVRGLRRTNKQTLDVAIAVLCGLVNAQLVAEMIALGGSAVGLSGVSGGLLKAKIKDPDLGLVGEIVDVDPRTVNEALDSGHIPVVAPAALHVNPCPDGSDRILNVNADTSAGHLASALNASLLVFQTDVEGVFDVNRRLIPQMTRRQALDMVTSGVAAGGMIPKIEACALAAAGAGTGHIIDGRVSGVLLECVERRPVGTRII